MGETREILIIFKTHLDLGFTDFAENVLNNYVKQYIPGALKVAKSLRERGGEERFVWTTGSWMIGQYFALADSCGIADMEEAIREGDISWHGLPFTTHTEAMDAELFNYGLSLSQQLDARFDRKTIASKMTDVPGHTRAMVPYLAKSGIEFLHIGVNPASTVPDVPPLFRWRAPSGEEVTVMYNLDYGKFTEIPGTGKAVYFAHTGDNMGPQSADAILALYDDLRKEYPGVKLTASDLNDVAQAVDAIKDTLPVVTDEIGDTWIHGVGTDPGKTSRYRTLLRLRKNWDENAREAINRSLLCIPEHTWGLDVKTHLGDHGNYDRFHFEAARSQANYQKMEQSWREQRGYLDKAVEDLDSFHKTLAIEEMQAAKKAFPKMQDYRQVQNPSEKICIGDDEIQFGNDGSIIYLSRKGKLLADQGHTLGRFSYQVFSKNEYERFFDQYVRFREGWPSEDFGKPGMEEAIQEGQDFMPKMTALYQKDQEFLVLLSMPEQANMLYGCPKTLALSICLDKESIVFDFAWWDKPASRIAEAMWLEFSPIGNHCRISKLGEWVDPLAVVENGNKRLHATDWGVSYQECKVQSLDASLVSFGACSLLNFTNDQPDLSKGVFYNLYNNIWGTNFPMWYDEDARFRFIIQC